MGEASRGKIGFARGDLLEGTIGQAEMEMASVVERFGDSCELGGAHAESKGATELEAKVAPILHGVGNRLEEALG